VSPLSSLPLRLEPAVSKSVLTDRWSGPVFNFLPFCERDPLGIFFPLQTPRFEALFSRLSPLLLTAPASAFLLSLLQKRKHVPSPALLLGGGGPGSPSYDQLLARPIHFPSPSPTSLPSFHERRHAEFSFGNCLIVGGAISPSPFFLFFFRDKSRDGFFLPPAASRRRPLPLDLPGPFMANVSDDCVPHFSF